MKFYVVCGCDLDAGTFNSVKEAEQAWVDAGKPKVRGNSVWINEEELEADGCCTTLRTITLQPA